MNNNNFDYNEIKNTIYSNDRKFKSSLKKFYKRFKTEHYFYSIDETIFIEDILNSINITDEEKIVFYIRTTLIDNLNGVNNFFTTIYLKEAFKKYIDENEDKFFNALEDDTLQTMYVNWFKSLKYIPTYDPNIYKKLLKLPKFKEIVLKDLKYISNPLISDDFFNYLPNDFSYLIALSKSWNFEKLMELYSKYFDNILSKEKITELVNTYINFNKEPNILRIKNENENIELLNCLKNITKSPKYFDILKKLSIKTNIDLKDIIKFSNKYSKTKFFYNLCIDKKPFDNKTIKKIKYLSNWEKIIEITSINNLNDITLSGCDIIEI